MIFYDFDVFAPNPWIVWIFAQEKGIPLERQVIDLFTRENRRAPFLTTVNPLGELPALRIGDRVLTEVVPICEYLEEKFPDTPLIGATAEERADTRMWVRRIDQNIAFPMGEGFSVTDGRAFFLSDHDNPDIALRKIMLPEEAGAVLKEKCCSKMGWLDQQMQDQPYVCGDRYSLADITLYCFLQFGENHGQPIPPEYRWLTDFFARMKARPHAWHAAPAQ